MQSCKASASVNAWPNASHKATCWTDVVAIGDEAAVTDVCGTAAIGSETAVSAAGAESGLAMSRRRGSAEVDNREADAVLDPADPA